MLFKSAISKYFKFFLIITFVYMSLSNSFITKAQSIKAYTNIEGTVWFWKSLKNITPTHDNSTIVTKIYYIFGQKGKLTILFKTDKFGGYKHTLVYNQVTGQYEYKYLPADPITTTKSIEGKYKIQSKNLVIEFRDSTIKARILENQIRGFIYYKSNKPKENWTITRVLNQNKNSISRKNQDLKRKKLNNNKIPSNGKFKINTFGIAKKIFIGKESSYPNVIINSNNTLRPAGCYEWIDAKAKKNYNVKLIVGVMRIGDMCFPAIGYQWIRPNDKNDFRVRKKQ